MTEPTAVPYWQDVALPEFPALDRDIEVDVVVVGGGLTGITTAYLLHNEGVRVALIDRGRFASADTGHTTSHLTYVTDYRLHELTKKFGKDATRLLWKAGAAAIDQIEEIVGHSNADCEFRRVPGYLHAPTKFRESTDEKKEMELLNKDFQLALEYGFDAKFVDDVDVVHRVGVRFENQAKFHPRKYLQSLLRTMAAANVPMFESTEFQNAERPIVHANGRRIHCDYVVIATHNPLMGMQSAMSATLFQTKLSLYTSYVVGAWVPANTLPEALFWDTNDPYDYLRVDSFPDHQYLIFGGEDVKTGQEKGGASSCFAQVTQRFESLIPKAHITHRWLGQVVETDDGLPFIGENAPGEFIATGFCGNGFTLGTVAAMMARDRFFGRSNEWMDLMRVDRKPFHGGTWRYITENVDFPVHLVGDRLRRSEGSLEDVLPGEGKIVSHEGDKVAAYRSESGELTLCSPVCTHMKCLVRWNDADSTWDCPCHGSRFHTDGNVHSGPAEQPLQRIELSKPEAASAKPANSAASGARPTR